jgi:hypothetical protein
MSHGWRGVVEKVMPESVRGTVGPAFGRAMDRLRVPPTGLKAGPQLSGPGRDRRPVALVLLLGAGAAQTDHVARALAGAVRTPSSVRPVLVVDGPFFAAVRRAGICVEHVMSEQQWSRQYPDGSHAEYLTARLDLLRRDYATDQILRLSAAGDDTPIDIDEGRLTELLRSRSDSWWRRLWLPLAVRAERAIDRPSSGA